MRSGESDNVLKAGGKQGSLLTPPFLFLANLNALPSTSILLSLSLAGPDFTVIWYFAWVFLGQEEAWCPQDLAECLEAAGGWLFHGAILCRWTQNVSSGLPRWCLESERAVRCLNHCWTWEYICYDGFAEHCFTDFLEKKKYLCRSWSL